MEKKLITLVNELKSQVRSNVKFHNGKIETYNKSFKENGLIHATVWDLESAMISEHFLKRYKPISDLIEKMESPFHLQELRRDLEYFFECSQFAPTSTSTTENFSRLCHGRACGLLHSSINVSLTILDKLDAVMISKKDLELRGSR